MTETSNNVRILDEALINKIAAGEVVERPASVVKELVENAIDAGAKQVLVTVKNGGKDLISVVDNGSGMTEEDARLAVERHATSKIRNEDDLFRIRTLGFRGEALAAIAAVSHFELLTCADEASGGIRLALQGGYLDHLGRTGFPQGTKITIERLFYNTPARLKFLKATATELHHIQSWITQQALSHPEIQFRLTHNQQLLLHLPGNQTLEARVQQLFGEEFRDTLLEVEHEEAYLRYDGLLSMTSKPHTSRRWQYLFVNGRAVKCPAVAHGVYDGYRTFLAKGQHPAFFLRLEVDPTEIDVNVHPAKTEIRFRNSQIVHAILADQLAKTLKEGASRRFFGRGHEELQRPSGPVEQAGLPLPDDLPIAQPDTAAELRIDPRERPPKGALQTQKTTPPPATIQQLPATSKMAPEAPEPQSPAPENLVVLDPLPDGPSLWHPLAQLASGWLLAESSSGFAVLSSHALHAHLLHETYREAFYKNSVPLREFEVPLLLELPPQETVLLEQNQAALKQGGIGLESFGPRTYAVRSLPRWLPEAAFRPLLDDWMRCLGLFGKRARREETHHDLWKVLAEHAAVPDSQSLSQHEQTVLLVQWEFLGRPVRSALGTRILLEFPFEELSRRMNN